MHLLTDPLETWKAPKTEKRLLCQAATMKLKPGASRTSAVSRCEPLLTGWVYHGLRLALHKTSQCLAVSSQIWVQTFTDMLWEWTVPCPLLMYTVFAPVILPEFNICVVKNTWIHFVGRTSCWTFALIFLLVSCINFSYVHDYINMFTPQVMSSQYPNITESSFGACNDQDQCTYTHL